MRTKKTESAKVTLSPPWNIFYREIQAFFKDDSQIKLFYDEGSNTVKLYVEDSMKADALSELLVDSKEFGNVTVNVEVISADARRFVSFRSINELYDTAFKNNHVYKYSKTYEGIFPIPVTYVVLENQVVQYYTDNLSDIYGLTSTLYQNIAKDIFKESSNVHYCTSVGSIPTISNTISSGSISCY